MDKKSALEAFVLLAHVLCEYANRVKSLNLVETYYQGCWYIEDKIKKWIIKKYPNIWSKSK